MSGPWLGSRVDAVELCLLNMSQCLSGDEERVNVPHRVIVRCVHVIYTFIVFVSCVDVPGPF